MSERINPCIHRISLGVTPPSSSECVVALGFFDGVHIGHAALLRAAEEEAQQKGLAFAVFTFSDCGDGTYKSGAPRLTEWAERMELFRSFGVDYVYAAEFSSLKMLSPREFVFDILSARLHARAAFCGFNFRFGAKAAGNTDDLVRLMEEAGGTAFVLPAMTMNGEAVSSTAVRCALEEGDLFKANAMLGRPFSINFPVIHGKMLGRTIGVPTINQSFPDGFVVPKHGVYACLCTVDGVPHAAVSNVGVRPTVENNMNVNCESHILDFDGWLYGRRVQITFLHFLREERRFSSLDDLVSQIHLDVAEARRILSTPATEIPTSQA